MSMLGQDSFDQDPGDDPVPAELVATQPLQRDGQRQLARAPDLQAVVEHERTPAMAAELTDYKWTVLELLSYQIPLPLWAALKRKRRPPKKLPQLEMAVAV
jgi:hypothetical protein